MNQQTWSLGAKIFSQVTFFKKLQSKTNKVTLNRPLNHILSKSQILKTKQTVKEKKGLPNLSLVKKKRSVLKSLLSVSLRKSLDKFLIKNKNHKVELLKVKILITSLIKKSNSKTWLLSRWNLSPTSKNQAIPAVNADLRQLNYNRLKVKRFNSPEKIDPWGRRLKIWRKVPDSLEILVNLGRFWTLFQGKNPHLRTLERNPILTKIRA